MKQLLLAAMCMLLATALGVASGKKGSLTNFRHLEHLMEEVQIQGEHVGIIHIYANYPDYRWVGAAESGPEGIACVDDAARAAVVLLRHFELRGEKESLRRAELLLRFIMKLQTDDGEFYNFIFADHSVNTSGRTSFKSFGWWGIRGLWALATGYRVCKTADPQFATLLLGRARRSLPNVMKLLERYGQDTTIEGFQSPTWLPYATGADVTSELVLGLLEYYRATGDTATKMVISKLADGMIMMQNGDARTFPYGLHRSWETMWHMWGNGQTQALAMAGRVFRNKSMIASAEREAQGFYSRLLIDGYLKEIDVHSKKTTEYEQIAYGVRPMVLGLLRLYEATHKEEYLKMAGLAASWLFGNNCLMQQMYDPATGRCYDGIRDSITVNKNSGAESTIEALMTVMEVERYAQARRFLSYRKIASGGSSDARYAIFRDAAGKEVTLLLDLQKPSVRLIEGKGSQEFWRRIHEAEKK